jgi:hypothetical protein
LLAFFDLRYDIAELRALLQKVLLEGRELHIFDDKGHLICVRVVALLLCTLAG